MDSFSPLLTLGGLVAASANQLDVLEPIELAFPCARAFTLELLPGLSAAQILRPKGKSPALFRPCGIDGATLVEEYAVAVGFLDQRVAAPDLSHVFFSELGGLEIEKSRDFFGFGVRDPDVSGSARAAITTLGAFEA